MPDRSASRAGIAAYVTDSFSNVNLEVEVPRRRTGCRGLEGHHRLVVVGKEPNNRISKLSQSKTEAN